MYICVYIYVCMYVCMYIHTHTYIHIYIYTYSNPSLEPVYCSMSGSNYCFLTSIQVSQEADKAVRYSSSLRIFHILLLTCTAKGFSVVNEADVFLEFCSFFCVPPDVGNLISCSSAFSKSSLYIQSS